MAEFLGFYKKFLQRRSLRKDSSAVPTGLLPLSKIASMTVIMDAEKRDFEECKNDIAYFCRLHNIRFKIFVLNIERIDSGERLITSITNTILRKDLAWRGTFKEEKQHLLFASPSDMLVVLTECVQFPLEYLVKCSRSRFKVGRVQLPGEPYDLLVTDPTGTNCSQSEAFKTVKNILKKIG